VDLPGARAWLPGPRWPLGARVAGALYVVLQLRRKATPPGSPTSRCSAAGAQRPGWRRHLASAWSRWRWPR
jgi:hypothetical protein